MNDYITKLYHYMLVLRAPLGKIRPHIPFLFDACLSIFSFIFSVFIVLGNIFFDYSHGYIIRNTIVFFLIHCSVFLWMQIHHTLWRYFSLEDCIPLALASILTTILYVPMMILLSQQEDLPKAVPIVNCLVHFTFLCLARYSYRTFNDRKAHQKKHHLNQQNIPVILVGSGYATELFIREIMHSNALSFNPLGIISPDVMEKGYRIHTVPILGPISPLPDIIGVIRSLSKRPQHIIITEQDLPLPFLQEVMELSTKLGVPMMQMITQFSVFKQDTIAERS